MQDKILVSGTSPLGIRITGSGAYVKNQLDHLQDFMDWIQWENEQDIRRDNQE